MLKREQILKHFLQVLEIFGSVVKSDYVAKKGTCIVLYVTRGTYRHLGTVEKNVYFKSVQQWCPEWEKWYLQKYMVLPNFHSMSNSIVDIEGEEDGERQIYIPLRIPYEE